MAANADFFRRNRCRFEIPVTVVSSSSPSPVFLLRSNMFSSFLARFSARCLRCLSASVSTLTSAAVLIRLLSEAMAVNVAAVVNVAFFLRRIRCRLDNPETADSSSSSPAFLLAEIASIFFIRASAFSLRFFSSSVSTLTIGSSLFPDAAFDLMDALDLPASPSSMVGRSKSPVSAILANLSKLSFVTIFLRAFIGDAFTIGESPKTDLEEGTKSACGMDRPLIALLSLER
mmetsp:Transcript_7451/g.13405  ORF Transcript_7451/g.13405 Transcript_7451/m.13405 type:complete len:231 (+) Transcript_7451:469-1161(+)